MTDHAAQALPDVRAEQPRLEARVAAILAEARSQGATAAEVAVSQDAGLSVAVRNGELETVEYNRDQGFGITLYLGQSKGSASTSDPSPAAVQETVAAALNIARYTGEDPCNGLADAELMPGKLPDLDLWHPWAVDVEQARSMAHRAEAAALALDPRITNSEGATLNAHRSTRAYGNSHGFVGSYSGTRNSLSVVVIGSENGAMERDYWYSVGRRGDDLEAPEAIGRQAAERTLARLSPGTMPTGNYPVVFLNQVATGLIGHCMGALSGGALYRRSSFLLDSMGEQIFPDFVTISEHPHLPRGLGSASFDGDGVATSNKAFIRDGVLASWALGAYSARRLGLTTTGNAGGLHNLQVSHGSQTLAELLATMGNGVLVTELMGQGVNAVTGDYSRGASGFRVENGQIAGPVAGFTIAGNLRDMFRNVVAIGADLETRGNTQVGSMLVDGMMVAGS